MRKYIYIKGEEMIRLQYLRNSSSHCFLYICRELRSFRHGNE